MVPGSTFRYGSNFIRLTVRPRLSSKHPIEAAASPLPNEDTTPPVTKMYFADIVSSPQLCSEICAGWGARSIMTESCAPRNRFLGDSNTLFCLRITYSRVGDSHASKPSHRPQSVRACEGR